MVKNIELKERKVKSGFTFAEILVGLVVLASILYLFQIINWHFDLLATQMTESRSRDFAQFLVSFEQEMAHYQIINAEDQIIYVQDQDRYFEILCQDGSIYKRPGFHPFLQGVVGWEIERVANSIQIWVLLDDEELYHGQILLQTENTAS